MPLTPVPFQDFSGGITDRYIGTDTNRASTLQNWLIDETKKAYVRDGTSIYPTRQSSTAPSGIYIGPQPFSHPVLVAGTHAYVANETQQWVEAQGANGAMFLGKSASTKESALIWRRQLVACAPVTGLPPSIMYATSYVQPANAATPAAYKVVTLGLPALATPPTVHYSAGDAYQTIYAFFYKYTFIDYTGTIFAFFGNPNKFASSSVSGFVNASAASDPSTSNIAITNIPALTNSGSTNYDTSSNATTNTTFTNNSTTATVVSATGIVVGAQLIAPGFAVNGTVVTAISGTTLTLSQPAIQSGTTSTVFSTLTVQIYRTINGGSVFFFDAAVANGTTSYTDAVSDANLQLQQVIYTSGNALGYDQPPQGAFAVTQSNDIFWWATNTTLYQSIQGAPGACPSSLSNQIDQELVGLSDVVSFPVLFCDKSVYRVEGNFDSFGNGGFNLREISKTAGCVSNSSIVKTPYGLVWFGNGGIYWTDGYNVLKVSKHLDRSYTIWANSIVAGEYDPNKNLVYWTVNTNGNFSSTINNAWLVLHLNYGIKDEGVFSLVNSENNFYPTAVKFSAAKDILLADVSLTQVGTWSNGASSMTVGANTGITVGQSITAAGIPYGTTVTSVSGTTIGLSKAANMAGSSVTVTFSLAAFSPLYNTMLFTEANGYLLWFDPQSLADIQINPQLYPSQMPKKTILYDYISAGLDQGTVGFRKYTPDMVAEMDGATPIAFQIQHRRDDGGGGWSGEGGTPPAGTGSTGSPGGGSSGNPGVPEIRSDGPISWNITDCPWLTDTIEHRWNDFATVSGKRAIPAGMLRSGRRQIRIRNAFTIIANSDTYGTATILKQVGTTLPTITLDNPANAWISDPEGYYITLFVDGYNQTYYINARLSNTVLQLTDPYGTLVNGSTKWEMKGYRKFERPRLVSYTLYAEVEGPTYGQATAPQGANA